MIRRERLPADIRGRLPELAEHFRKVPEVVAIYLFGSFARGEEGPLSDIDIALLLRPGMAREQMSDLSLEALAQANRLLGTDEVGFVLLNEAPLTLRYRVVSEGQVLVDNDPSLRLAFEVHTEDLYMDFKPLLDAYDDELLRQLAAPAA
jgi:predicted nucleotidyltransferase